MANTNDPRAMYDSGEISSRSSRRNSIINKISGGTAAIGETAVSAGKGLYDYTLSDNAPELVKSHKDAALLMLGGPIGSMFARSIAKETVGTLSNTIGTLKQNYKENVQQGEYDSYDQPDPIEEIEEIYRSDEAVVNKRTKIKVSGKKQRVEVTEKIRNKKVDPITKAKNLRSNALINSKKDNSPFTSFDKTTANAIISKNNKPDSNTILGSETLSKRDLQFITYLSKSIMAKMEKSEQRTLAAKLTNNFAKNIGEALITAIPMLRMFNATKYSTQLPNAKKVGVFNAMNITLGMLYAATRSIGFETNRLIYSLINVSKIGMGVNLKVKPPTDITTFTEMIGAGFRKGMSGAFRGATGLLGALTGLSGGAPLVASGHASPYNYGGQPSRLRRYATTGAKIAGYGALGAAALGLTGMTGLVPGGAAIAPGAAKLGGGILGSYMPAILGALGKVGGYGLAAASTGAKFLGGALGGSPLLGLVAGLGGLRLGLGASRMLTQGALSGTRLGKFYQKTPFGKVHMSLSGQKKNWLSSIPNDDTGSILKYNSARDSAYQQSHLSLAQSTLLAIQTSGAQARYFYEKSLKLKTDSIQLDYEGYKKTSRYQEEDSKLQKSEKKEQSWFRKTMSFFTSVLGIIGKGLLGLSAMSAFSLATGSGGDFGTDIFENLFKMKGLDNIDLTGGLLSGLGKSLKYFGKKIPGLSQMITVGDALANIWNGADISSAVGIAGGTVIGGGVGMSTGASIGTMVAGPIGTVIGGVAGTILGSFLGAIAGEKAINFGKKFIAVQGIKLWELMQDAGLTISQSFEYIITKGMEILETGFYKVVNTISAAAGFSFRISAGDKYTKMYEEMDTRHTKEWATRIQERKIAYDSIPIVEELADNTALSWNKDKNWFELRAKTDEEKGGSIQSGQTSLLSSITSWFSQEKPVEASKEAKGLSNAASLGASMGVPGSNYKRTGNELIDKSVDGLSWLYQKTGITFTDPSYLNVPNSSGSTSTSNSTTMQPKTGSGKVKIPDHFKELVYKYSELNGLDPDLVAAVITRESHWDPLITSKKGARGLMQLMPGTAADLGVSDVTNPEQNIKGGTKYLGDMIKQFGSVELGLAAYNAGPGNVLKYGGIPPFEETQEYVKIVMGLYNNGSKTSSSSGTMKPSTPSSGSQEAVESTSSGSIAPSWSNLSDDWWVQAKQTANEAAGYVNKWMDKGGVENTVGSIKDTAQSLYSSGKSVLDELYKTPLSPEGIKSYLKANYNKIPELKEIVESSSGISMDEIIDNYMNGEKLSSAYTASNLSEAFGSMTDKTTKAMSEVGSGMKSIGNQMFNIVTSIASSSNSTANSTKGNGNGESNEVLDSWPSEVKSLIYGYYD